MRLTGKRGTNWPEGWEPDAVDAAVASECEKRISIITDSLTDVEASSEEVRLKWCEMTMNPLVNSALASRSASVTVS